jgi:hypothetical protein
MGTPARQSLGSSTSRNSFGIANFCRFLQRSVWFAKPTSAILDVDLRVISGRTLELQHIMVTEQGWSHDRHEAWLRDALEAVLLSPG